MKNQNLSGSNILYTSKRSFIKELYHNFIVFKVEHKSAILKVIFSIYIVIGLLVSSLAGYKAYAYASTGSFNTVKNQDNKQQINEVKHILADVVKYDNGTITVEYNGQYHEFTSNSKYVDYAKEQYTELAEYKCPTYIIVDSNGNIDEDTEQFDNSDKVAVDARQGYIDNNKSNPEGFKVSYTDDSYYIDNEYLNKYVCYNAVNGDIESWLSSEDMHEYMKENWNNKIPVTGMPQ